MHVTAVIVAAGVGSRMGGPVNKHLLLLADRPVLVHAVAAFEHTDAVDDIVLVGGEERLEVYRQLVEHYGLRKVRAIVAGGDVRQESVACGLAAVTDAALVATHDGARPLISPRTIEAAIAAGREWGAAVVAVPAKDTIKLATTKGLVAETLPRERLWQIQTPQVFRLDILRRAMEAATAQGFVGTDEAVLVERLGLPVKIVPGEYSNIKITTAEDLVVAERLLAERMP